MNGRILSLLALAGSLATLVLVGTFAGAGDPATEIMPAASEASSPAPAWTRFKVRPVVLSSDGALSERPSGAALPQQKLATRALFHFVRHHAANGRVVLASRER